MEGKINTKYKPRKTLIEIPTKKTILQKKNEKINKFKI